ncbi:MAG: hypothetical protein GXP41_03465 [Chloroflexi bacterium]|nr:hypothetical protein [Chloroflexota bacterium]
MHEDLLKLDRLKLVIPTPMLLLNASRAKPESRPHLGPERYRAKCAHTTVFHRPWVMAIVRVVLPASI